MSIVKKPLSVFSLVMINIIAIDNIRSLNGSAFFGLSILSYYLILGLLFFVPIALVSAELATGWPHRGGIYIWVREAFGSRWGFFVIWMQWIYNVIWYPTQMIFITIALMFVCSPQDVVEWRTHSEWIMLGSVALFGLATLLNLRGMKLSSCVSTLGAIIGTLLPMVCISVLGVIWLATGHESQTPLQWSALWPADFNEQHLGYLVLVMFGLMGIEMSAVHADEVHEPQKAYPRAIWISMVVIIVTLVCSSLAISVIVPQERLDVISAVYTSFGSVFQVFFGYAMPWLTRVVALMVVIGGFSAISAWIIGPSKGIHAAAKDGIGPRYLAAVNQYGVPHRILWIQYGVFLVLISLLHFMKVETVFLILTAVTSQLALLAYVVMLIAAVVLRYRRADVRRNYRVPGGMLGLSIVVLVGVLMCCVGLWLGMMRPDEIVGRLSQGEYTIALLAVLAILSIIPFVLHQEKRHERT